MKKLLIFDIDGTLMSNGKISKKVIETLNEVRKQGHYISIATGRNSRSIRKIAEILGIDDGKTPIIGLNGAEVFYLNPDGSVKHLWQKTFPKEKTMQIFELAKTNKISLVAYPVDERFLYTNTKISWLNLFMLTRAKGAKFIRIKPDLANITMDVIKFVSHGKVARIVDFKNELLKLDLSVFAWSYSDGKDRNLEINMCGIDKSIGMKEVAKILSVTQSDVVYFGDGPNDKEALQWAGIGVAMGNANDQIKQCANQITKTVKENGVATWIEENLLKK